jgi:hypothetical protein
MHRPVLFGWAAFLGAAGATLAQSVLVFKLFPSLLYLFGMPAPAHTAGLSGTHLVIGGWALWFQRYAGPVTAVSVAALWRAVSRAVPLSLGLTVAGISLLVVNLMAPAAAFFVPGILLVLAGITVGVVAAETTAAAHGKGERPAA